MMPEGGLAGTICVAKGARNMRDSAQPNRPPAALAASGVRESVAGLAVLIPTNPAHSRKILPSY